MTTREQKTIGFIGCGRMATAIAQGLVSAGFAEASRIVGSDPLAETRERFGAESGGRAVATNAEVVKAADVLILAVKPQQMGGVLGELKSLARADQLVVSVAAGVTLSQLAKGLGIDRRIVRVMPNTPCLVQAGATAFARGEKSTAEDAEFVRALFRTIGIVEEVPEKLLDAVTGLSGSGPAYAFQVIEALSDGGVAAGLPRAIATRLAAQTVLGAAKMVLETGEHPGALKDAVASPGGTTIAGLHELERGGLRGALMNAVVAATKRSEELGR